MSNPIVISSDDKIENIHSHFKVIAGPGAGKTYWLIEHLKNVIHNSKNITNTSKIACITYTTVGVEEILNRLDKNIDNVEVSTIHGFLYKNIVKPYAHLLLDEEGEPMINIEEMSGHVKNIASPGKVYQWQSKVNNSRYITDKIKVKECLEELDWILEENDFILKPRNEFKRRIGTYFIKVEDFPAYKKLFWDEGVIHHEDVLYFSYRLLKKHPILLEHISAKYPFMFLDEFQDTNPIQAEIIKWIGKSGTVIGVIGDPAQSIFKFQGATREKFIDFSLPNQIDLKIENNRRSGKKIVQFLNHIRQGDSLSQKEIRTDSFNNIYYMECSGNVDQTISRFHDLRKEMKLKEDYCILARRNDTVQILNNSETTEVWTDFSSIDRYRESLLKSLLSGYKLVNDQRIDMAIKEIIRNLKTNQEDLLREPFQDNQFLGSISKRGLAVDLLEFVVNKINYNKNQTIFEFYNSLNDLLNEKGYTLKRIMRGKIREFSEETTVQELLNNLILPEEKSTEIRTIHKAKGAEFESVMVYFNDEKEIENLLNPDIDASKDDTRILYVALSRAEDLLCLVSPPLESKIKKKIEDLNIREWPKS